MTKPTTDAVLADLRFAAEADGSDFGYEADAVRDAIVVIEYDDGGAETARYLMWVEFEPYEDLA